MKARLFFLAFACCAAATVSAQQMTIDRATEVYEKRLVAAEKVKADETAKINAAYEDSVRRTGNDFANRVKAALRTARDEDETAKLQKMLADATGEDTAVGSSASVAPKGEMSVAEFDALFDKLVGVWHGSTYTGESDSRGNYKYFYTYEFRHPKLLVRGGIYVYDNPRERDRTYKYGEYRARLREGKIVFERTGSQSTGSVEQYEIAIPFDLNNLSIVQRTKQRGYSDTTTTRKLTKAPK